MTYTRHIAIALAFLIGFTSSLLLAGIETQTITVRDAVQLAATIIGPLAMIEGLVLLHMGARLTADVGHRGEGEPT